MRRVTACGILALAAAGTACRPRNGDDALLQQRAARLEQALADSSRTDSSGPLARWIMPASLAEISGLALDSSGRLFAHNDESGLVFEIDYRRGVLLKQWVVGERPLRDDFEAMAVADGRFFLLASTGKLYEFREGESGERVPYTVHDTRLGNQCEFESLAHERASNSLVLICKSMRDREIDGVVLFRWSLDSAQAERTPVRQIISLATINGANDWEEFQPSDLSIDPVSGNLVMVASLQQALAEVTRSGDLVASGPLPEPLEMAEGVAVTRDGLLIISTEATRTAASVSVYRR